MRIPPGRVLWLTGFTALAGCHKSFDASLPVQELTLPAVSQAASVPASSFLVPGQCGLSLSASINDSALAACIEGQDVIGRLPLQLAAVQIGLDQLSVAGCPLLPLDGGVIPGPELRGQQATRLYDRLLEFAESGKSYTELGCAPWAQGQEPAAWHGRLLLIVDRQVPLATLAQVVHTAAQAQYSEFHFLVQADERSDAGEPTASTLDLAWDRLKDRSSGSYLAELASGTEAGSAPGPISIPADQQLTVLVGQLPEVVRKPTLLRALDANLEGGIGGLIGAHGPPPRDGDDSRTTGQARMGALELSGLLDRSLVEAVINRHMHQLRYCYQRELYKHPGLAGGLELVFEIEADGGVSTASVASDTLDSDTVNSCFIGRTLRMQFPEPKDGATVEVKVAFEMEGGNQAGPR